MYIVFTNKVALNCVEIGWFMICRCNYGLPVIKRIDTCTSMCVYWFICVTVLLSIGSFTVNGFIMLTSWDQWCGTRVCSKKPLRCLHVLSRWCVMQTTSLLPGCFITRLQHKWVLPTARRRDRWFMCHYLNMGIKELWKGINSFRQGWSSGSYAKRHGMLLSIREF